MYIIVSLDLLEQNIKYNTLVYYNYSYNSIENNFKNQFFYNKFIIFNV